jgi:hypothetical protein
VALFEPINDVVILAHGKYSTAKTEGL